MCLSPLPRPQRLYHRFRFLQWRNLNLDTFAINLVTGYRAAIVAYTTLSQGSQRVSTLQRGLVETEKQKITKN